jgi:hypothetical protein
MLRRSVRAAGAAAVRERGGRPRQAEAAGAAAGGAGFVGDGQRMAELKARRDAYCATAVYRLGSAASA